MYQINIYNIFFSTILFAFVISFTIIFSQEESNFEPWKRDVQLLLGFKGNEIDGIMGMKTFDSLKEFAKLNDISDVVLRGEYEDLGFWGFQQYMLKYHQYWIRELKNQKIIEDVSDREYLIQADETLYSFEIAIENAKLEVERLNQSKARSRRLAKEKQELNKWDIEKKEIERVINLLKENIIIAEEEAEKWSLERLRARRLAEEQEQLYRLEERKMEALLLTSELSGVINLAKNETDRLIVENERLKELIINSSETKNIALELRKELESTRTQIELLSLQKDSLEKKLQEVQFKAEDINSNVKRKWYKFLWPFGEK